MTVYPPRPPSFTCAICGDHRDWSHGFMQWRNSIEFDIPPVCRVCEITWGKSIGGWDDRNRDRRIARQIAALAAAIDVEAYRAMHGKGPLNAPR